MKKNIHLCVGVSERVKLKRSDYPLVLRIMQGPCEQVCKVFLMEEDLGEEVTYDVMEPVSAFLASCFMPDIVLIAACRQKNPVISSLERVFHWIPPGGAVHQVWNARPAELYHQTEGGGGQRGPETSEKVREHFQSWIIPSLVVSTSHIKTPLLSSPLVTAGILICGVWLKNSSVVFQRAQRVGDLFSKTTVRGTKRIPAIIPLHISSSQSAYIQNSHVRCKFVHVCCIF